MTATLVATPDPKHPAPGDLYRGPAGGGAVLVLEPGDQVVLVERMSSGLTVRIPTPMFRAVYRLSVPRRYPWRG